MLRCLVLLAFAIGCSTLRRDDGSGADAVEAKSATAATCAPRDEVRGVVVYDPQFHTRVHPPHRGTFVAPSVKTDDVVAARAQLAEIVWGPNRAKIVAPVAGVIVHAGAAIGSYLHESDAPFVIADPTRLAVRIDSAPAGLRPGTSLSVTIPGVDDAIVAPVRTREGASVWIALPLGLSPKVGTTTRAALECTS